MNEWFSNFRGEIACLAAAAVWACSMSMFSRFGRNHTAFFLNSTKLTIALFFLTVSALVFGDDWVADLHACGLLAASGIIGLGIGDTALMAALKRLNVGLAAALQCLAPPFTSAIAWFVLGETLSLAEFIGIAVTTLALLALVLVERPARKLTSTESTLPEPYSVFTIGLVLALISAVCQAVGLVISRFAFQSMPVFTGTIWRIAPALVFLLAFKGYKHRKALRSAVLIPTWNRNYRMILIASFLGTFLGAGLASAGTKYAKAGIAATLLSTYPLWIMPISIHFMGERPKLPSILLVIVAVFGIALMFSDLSCVGRV